MSSKKKISISLRNQNQESRQEVVQAKKEQAAATNAKSDDDHPGYEKKDSNSQVYQLPFTKKKGNQSPVKHLIVSTLTALVISLGLGFLLLRMFVTLTDETPAGQGEVPAAIQGSAQEEEVNPGDGISLELPVIQSYVVQAGVFSTEEKAREWKNKLIDQAVSSIIWEREGQFYLFIGSASTKSEADALAANLSARGVTTYVKPWTIVNGDQSFTGTEAQVVKTVAQRLENHSLHTVSKGKREELVNKLKKSQSGSSPLLGPLQSWADESETALDWLTIAYTLEKMTK